MGTNYSRVKRSTKQINFFFCRYFKKHIFDIYFCEIVIIFKRKLYTPPEKELWVVNWPFLLPPKGMHSIDYFLSGVFINKKPKS